ncbi:MAG: hypothetical protein JXQ29_12785, partial [Planctomycetes bacterium]|nr:hypothetical protein [Planctomycetota bacterium]
GSILRTIALLAITAGAALAWAPHGGAQDPGPPVAAAPFYHKPHIIPLEGDINTWSYDTFVRRVESALSAGADLIIAPLDTPGGELGAAFKFGDFIFNKIRPRARIVFYITNHALSAGALIALAGHEIVMGPGGTIGDCQPILMGAEGIIEGPEKIQSPIRATFRKYAAANGYPEALAESMVSKEIEVLELVMADERVVYVRADDFEQWTDADKGEVAARKVVVKKDELLTMTAREAERYGFARAVVDSREELGRLLGIERLEAPTLQPTWSEEMVRAVQAWNILFVLIGLLCLYLEFKTPGFGFFGVTGILAFAIYFFFGYLTGLSAYWEIALCLVGLFLIGLEIFVVPGFGVPGLLGIGCVLVGLFAGGLPDEFFLPSMPYQRELFEAALLRFAAALAGVVVAAILIGRHLPSIPILNRLILATAAEAPYAEAIPGRESAGPDIAVGSRGEALTPLRPTGTARFGSTRMDVVTQGEFIERGAAVRVVRTAHNRIVVVEDTA